MKNKIHKEVLFEIGPVLIFFFLGQTTFLDKILILYLTESAINDVKVFFNYISVVYTFIVIGIRMNNLTTENQYYRDSRKYLFDRHKEDFLLLLTQKELDGTIYNVPNNIQIRIWVKPKLIEKIQVNLKNRRWYKYLEIRNYESLGARGKTDDLQFEVFPKPQGLVGKCYNSKEVEYSWNLQKEDQRILYNMTEGQNEQTNDLGFCLCYPVKENGHVVAVISFDSTEPMDVDANIDDREITNIFVGFSVDLYKSSFHLFK